MVLTLRYTNEDKDVLIGTTTIINGSIAHTIAHFEAIRRDSKVRVTHYLNVDKIFGFGNPDTDWIKVPYYLT